MAASCLLLARIQLCHSNDTQPESHSDTIWCETLESYTGFTIKSLTQSIIDLHQRW